VIINPVLINILFILIIPHIILKCNIFKFVVK